ncbi:radical SAM protein [Streptomyces scabiei]|uniref:radical SAM protein n=1 Tax=Streptomyces scabiei TaxID=1930 RepID=UPI002FF28E84
MTPAPGHQPQAYLRQFVLKVHSRCNLDCDYCYVYHSADTSWRDKPRLMDAAVAERVAGRIAEHATAHDLPDVGIVLHGGEPLLLGARRLEELLGILGRCLAKAGVPVRFSAQTNGVLLTPDILDVLLRHRVDVSVSLDGTRAGHDRHRVFPGARAATGGWRKGSTGCARTRTAPCTRACCARSTWPTTPWTPTRPCWPHTPRVSTSCCRTARGTPRLPDSRTGAGGFPSLRRCPGTA